jgi:superfamily II DNA or RNA helicase
MAAVLTSADLDHAFPHATRNRATELWAFDAVDTIHVSDDQRRITSAVKGSQAHPYTQTITLSVVKGRTHIHGVCTCSVAFNCKHVGAALLEHLHSEDQASHETTTTLAVELNPRVPVQRSPPDATPGTALAVSPPDATDDIEFRPVRPIPRLQLMTTPARLDRKGLWYTSDPRVHDDLQLPIARLAFDYGDQTVPFHATSATLESIEDGTRILTPRDGRAELAAAEVLVAHNLTPLFKHPFTVDKAVERDLYLAPPGSSNIYDFIKHFDDPKRFIAFSMSVLPKLEASGWRVAYADDYPYRIAVGNPQWWAGLDDHTGIDWMSFALGIDFEGQRINLIPYLTEMLARLPPDIWALAFTEATAAQFLAACQSMVHYQKLPDGRLLPLPGERIAPILQSLLDLIGPRGRGLDDGTIKLRRSDACALAAFAGRSGVDIAWSASSERLIALGQRLIAGRGTRPVKPPKSFKAKLRPYQSDGLAWFDLLRETEFGGVLADDMGLGKTVQTLAFLAREKSEGRLDRPALIVAPTSVLPNWQAEAERFAPKLKVLGLRGADRAQLFGAIANHDLILTTYPLLVRDQETLLAQTFHVAVLDEAQAIKNPRANVSIVANEINARHRFALTGTPLENNLSEVWSLFQFLSPGLLGDEAAFRRVYRTPIEKHGDTAAQACLAQRLRPFMLRRTKTEVAKELPPKTQIIERVRLDGGQRDLYETVRALMHDKVRDEIAKKGLAKSHIIFLDALLKLRQICCDPRLLKMPLAKKVKSSAKLERLMEMIPELVGEGRRILVFSQFTSMLALIETELDARKIPYVQLTGDTQDRATPVRDFQAGRVPLFLLSLKAGGTGLNLTAADTVIHYDPWWNPAIERQATDRAHRIGQLNPVFVYKMIVEDGIEEAIELLKAKKASLAEALFEGGAKTPFDLTEADVAALFRPLGPAPGLGAMRRKVA